MSENVQHLGQITVNAIVYKQMPDGQFHPEAVWHDSFALNFTEDSAGACVEKVKQIIAEIKPDERRPDSVA